MVPPLLRRNHRDPCRVWRFGGIRGSQCGRKPTYDVDRGLGADQHGRFRALGRGVGLRSFTRVEDRQDTPVSVF